MTNAILSIEYEVNALHMNPHALHASQGAIGQCVATKGHPLQTDQTLDMKKQNKFTSVPKATEEKIMTVPGDHLTLPENHTPFLSAP